jgi:hypothetical protein
MYSVGNGTKLYTDHDNLAIKSEKTIYEYLGSTKCYLLFSKHQHSYNLRPLIMR